MTNETIYKVISGDGEGVFYYTDEQLREKAQYYHESLGVKYKIDFFAEDIQEAIHCIRRYDTVEALDGTPNLATLLRLEKTVTEYPDKRNEDDYDYLTITVAGSDPFILELNADLYSAFTTFVERALQDEGMDSKYADYPSFRN